VINKAICAHQVPVLLLTDNGAAFNQTRRGLSSKLVTHLQAQGCRAITGRPGHPQTQGKDERVHQTTQRWLRARARAGDHAELLAQLEEFDQHYNNHRPHQSLAMTTPAQVLAQGLRALPPQPPQGSRHQAAPAIRALRRRVDAHGKTSIKQAFVQLGHEHRNSTVTVILHGQNVTVFDGRGTLIRSLRLEPGRRYYGNGRPRGGNHNTQPSRLT
jgi:putative transposase